jgi:hypothetical protein
VSRLDDRPCASATLCSTRRAGAIWHNCAASQFLTRSLIAYRPLIE